MRKYWQVYTNAVQDAFEDRGRLFVFILQDFIAPLIQIILWIGIFKFSGGIATGWSISHLISYYLVLTFFSLTLNHYAEMAISNDIYSGDIANYVVKPVSYLGHVFIGGVGWKVVRLFMSLIPYIFLVFMFRQYVAVSFSFSGITTMLVFASVAFLSMFFYKVVIGLTAFWLIENFGVLNFFWAVQVIFTGLLVPFDFLPSIFKQISFFLPFRFFYYLPTIVFLNQDSIGAHLADLAIALSWLIILAVLSSWLYKKGLTKLTDIQQ